MRKIEKAMCLAIGQRKTWKDVNTSVEYQNGIDCARVYLHGNHIGTFIYSLNQFNVNMTTLAKWPTRTTKSRLRALGANV